jgi:hypothetical protein
VAWARVSLVPQKPPPLPDFTRWPSFPFEGDMRVKNLAEPVEVEPPRSGEDAADCVACNTPDDAYIWVSERWRVRGMDRPTGLPMVLILECRSHLDIGDLPNLLAAELGVMTVRLERAIRSLDGVARVHVNRWGDGSAHLHMWFLARPYGRLQLRGTFLSLWDDLLPVIPEEQWQENLALVAEWLAGFGGRAIAEPAHIHWLSPSTFGNEPTNTPDTTTSAGTWSPTDATDSESDHSTSDSTSNLTAVDEEARAANHANAPTAGNGPPRGEGWPTSRRDEASTADSRMPAGYSPNGPAAGAASDPEAQTPERPSASSAATAKAETTPAGDASGTGTAATTATKSEPTETGTPNLNPNRPAASHEQGDPAAKPQPDAARPIPAQ